MIATITKLCATILLLVSFSSLQCHELSPYGTGFALGSVEDIEIRLEWAKKYPNFKHGFSENSVEMTIIRLDRAKKDQCFKHGFGEHSVEAMEIKKFWIIKNGPKSTLRKCSK